MNFNKHLIGPEKAIQTENTWCGWFQHQKTTRSVFPPKLNQQHQCVVQSQRGLS